MVRKILAVGAILLFSQLLSAKEAFNPLVLFQGEVEPGSYLYRIERGISRFEESTNIMVARKHLIRDNSLYIQELKESATSGYNPIIVQDSNSITNFEEIAKSYPSTRFISLDVAYDVPNVLGLTFNHAEGAYVIGYAAGLKSKTNKVGFIGGMTIPVIENFQCGYELGVKDANKNVMVSVDYINKGAFSWDDVETAQKLTQVMLDGDVDVVFPVAGFASKAVMETMKTSGTGGYSFGIDYNYNQQYPETLIASFEKRADKAIFAALMLLNNDIWNSNEKHFGIKQEIINIAINHDNPTLTKAEIKKINDLIVQLKGNNSAVTHKISMLCQM
ncbi:BMP family ABC transporter substrate-binding protein [Aliivibrio kagoshimensis]|uniref:BMP family ABC transporter substrate-binding protein n=1 Tax=Aliivibrio kagoshimensis TaxID=2910230 RepID=UPI003D12B5A2